jgi:Uri superfamily endonuclease
MKGTYTVIILLNANSRIRVQKLGCFTFQKGFYAYTGSALGNGSTSLKRRLARHLAEKKIKHWHIDFLLASKNARITNVVVAESSVRKECQINNLIKNIEGATIPVAGFGASDCKQNCKSHLVYFGEESINEKIVRAYAHLFERAFRLKHIQEYSLKHNAQ